MSYFCQICSAVRYCQERGVKVGVLNPMTNILVDESGQIKLLLVDTYNMLHGGNWNMIGTQYAAPEQFKGSDYQTQKAEIWSLGVLVYEILAQKSIWGDKDLMALAQSILKDKIPSLPDHIHEKLRSIVDSCLVRDPSARASI